MRSETIAALNAINRRFYHERSQEFSETRERPWRGWVQLFDRAALSPTASVLDVGCGNGRLARFLRARLGRGLRYTGVDSSPLALAEARRRLDETVELYEHDFLATGDPLPGELVERRFDFVALFGVLHHVPSQDGRIQLVRGLVPHVRDRLALTVWLFGTLDRFRSKLVPWPAYLAAAGDVLDPGDLEPGDHIMTWGNDPVGYRFCHALSDDEEARLVASSGLELVDRFEPENEPNRYVVLQRRRQP